LLIDEIGYASVVGTTIHPAIAYREGRPPSMNEQANAYAALLAAARSQTSWLRGIVWWNFAQYSGTPSTNREFSMRGKKAECVLAKNWSSHTLPQLAAAGMIPSFCIAANL
jgi:hypothetical protein